MTDYNKCIVNTWLIGLDGLVEKSSFPFHRSDYLCVAMFEVPKIQFFLLVPDEGTLVQLGPHGSTCAHLGLPR